MPLCWHAERQLERVLRIQYRGSDLQDSVQRMQIAEDPEKAAFAYFREKYVINSDGPYITLREGAPLFRRSSKVDERPLEDLFSSGMAWFALHADYGTYGSHLSTYVTTKDLTLLTLSAEATREETFQGLYGNPKESRSWQVAQYDGSEDNRKVQTRIREVHKEISGTYFNAIDQKHLFDEYGVGEVVLFTNGSDPPLRKIDIQEGRTQDRAASASAITPTKTITPKDHIPQHNNESPVEHAKKNKSCTSATTGAVPTLLF